MIFIQIYINYRTVKQINNLDLEGMDVSSKNNFSKTEQSELPKLINDKTIIIKPTDKGAQ